MRPPAVTRGLLPSGAYSNRRDFSIEHVAVRKLVTILIDADVTAA